MSHEPSIPVERVLPPGGAGTFTAEEANAILEVAYLATAADETLDEEELSALRAVASGLRRLDKGDAGVSLEELDAALGRFAQNVDHAEPSERLTALAQRLSRPLARHTAYKVAFAMALCDLGTSDEEEDFDAELVEALGLSDDEAEDLAQDVYEALGMDEDDGDDEDDEDDEDDSPEAG